MFKGTMKKITGLFAVALFSTSLLTPLANAETLPYYVGIYGGPSKLNEFCTNATVGYSCKDTSIAYGLTAGYQINNIFGVELAYGKYGSTKTSGTVLGSNLELTQETAGGILAGTANLPISKSFVFTGKLGASYTNSSIYTTVTPGPIIPVDKTKKVSLAYGIGMQYAFNPSLALHVQYENLGKIGDNTKTAGSENTLTLLTVGLSYHFNIGRSRHKKQSYATKAENKVQAAQTQSAHQAMRVVVFLQQELAADKKKLTAAVAAACQCEPASPGLYNSKAVIYQLDMAPERTFSVFKNALMSGDASADIKGIMKN